MTDSIDDFETIQGVSVIGVLLFICGLMWFYSRTLHRVGL
jgi:hypothetical protein